MTSTASGFNQEADMVATLRHPNIVTIFGRGDFDGRRCGSRWNTSTAPTPGDY